MYPVKINDWKMNFPFKMIPVQGHLLIFGGSTFLAAPTRLMDQRPKFHGISPALDQTAWISIGHRSCRYTKICCIYAFLGGAFIIYYCGI